MNALHNRIIEISKKHNLSHLGSCLTAVNIISDIYFLKKEDEPFILSCGHSFLGLAVVLEQHYGFDAEKLYLKHGTHPNRDLEDKIYCSTGSLGQGLGIALGMAMADRTKNVYCLISDGESFEGIVWEVANVIYKYEVDNLKVYCNWNGFGAYDKMEPGQEERLSQIFDWNIKIIRTNVEDYGLTGQAAHYCKL